LGEAYSQCRCRLRDGFGVEAILKYKIRFSVWHELVAVHGMRYPHAEGDTGMDNSVGADVMGGGGTVRILQ
jgi:hypothetical protein